MAPLPPPAVKVDIIGTTFTRGIFSSRHDTATRQATLQSTTEAVLFNNTKSDYQRAVNAFIASEGLYYPPVFGIDPSGNDTLDLIGPLLLPMQKCRAQRYGTDKMLVTAVYQRTPDSDQQDNPFLRATFRTLDTHLTVFRSSTDKDGKTDVFDELGMPAGTFLTPGIPDANGDFSKALKPVDSEQWPVSGLLVKVSLNIVVDLSLLTVLEPFRDKINRGPVIGFGGFSFSAHTIWFRGYEIDYVGDGISNVGLYFDILAPGWLEQKVVANENPGDPPVFVAWTTEVAPLKQTADFTQFPL